MFESTCAKPLFITCFFILLTYSLIYISEVLLIERMLPSMPLLFSSSTDSIIEDGNKQVESAPKDQEVKDNGKDSKQQMKICISNEIPDFTFESIPEDEKECDDELVLMAENSPFGEKRKLHAQATATRKKRRIDPVETFLEDRNSNDEQANHFAMAYFMKAKGELDEQTFQKFIALLSELDEETLNVVALHKEMSALLAGYPELSEEFIGFLHPHQAVEVDKLTEFLHFEQSWNFFRKLDAFHLNKVNHLLEQHSQNAEVTSDGVRTSFASAFKGHPSIAEGLLSLMPDGKPPHSCKEDYEDISELGSEDSSWERLSITDSMSRGCVPGECDCCCHSSLTKKFCTFCNVKFSKGQIYVQTGKGLRFAKVTFRGCDQEEVLWRLHPTFYNKPVSRKRTKSSSHQSKDVCGAEQVEKRDALAAEMCKGLEKMEAGRKKEEVEVEKVEEEVVEKMEEEEEILFLESQLGNDIHSDEQYSCSDDLVPDSTNSDEPKDLEFDPGDELVANASPLPKICDDSLQQGNDTNDDIAAENTIVTKYKGSGSVDRPGKTDASNTVSGEDIDSSEQGVESPKSEGEPCKKEVKAETEINETVSKSFISDVISDKGEEAKVWTREEDKLILEAFKQQHSHEQAFSKISSLLPSRSIEDIQGRFQVLMNLLEQMTNGCYESSAS